MTAKDYLCVCVRVLGVGGWSMLFCSFAWPLRVVNGDLTVIDIFSQHSGKRLTSFVWLKHRPLIFFRTRCLAGKGINPSCTYSVQQTHSETPSQDQSGSVNGLTSRQGSQADCPMTFPVCLFGESEWQPWSPDFLQLNCPRTLWARQRSLSWFWYSVDCKG